MRVLESLNPKNVFYYFEDICRIPHGSGNEQQISDYCVAFAKEHGLKYRQEPCGNIIIWKDGTPGYENSPTVILQGHMDMVAVKTLDSNKNMETEGLDVAISEDGEWVYAKNTTLGADDGIAVAYALAILDDDTLEHPPLEAIFTVGEEVGLIGATALDASDLKGRILLNMDSEEDGIFLTSCAGGARIDCRVPITLEEKTGAIYRWSICNLQGGHSGAEIHLGHANANLILARFLAQVSKKCEMGIVNIAGGEKDNAIPVDSSCILVVDSAQEEAFLAAAQEFNETIKKEYIFVEPDINLSVEKQAGSQAMALNADSAKRAIALYEHLPFGIQRMMPEVEGMVQTSLNMGIVAMTDSYVTAGFAVRSSVGTEKEWMLQRMVDLTELLGGTCEITGVYSAWEYKAESPLRTMIAETFEEITGQKPVLTGIHAGVECGIFCEKLPGIDCISYGPQMHDIHTTRERLGIASVKTNYDLTVAMLKKLK